MRTHRPQSMYLDPVRTRLVLLIISYVCPERSLPTVISYYCEKGRPSCCWSENDFLIYSVPMILCGDCCLAVEPCPLGSVQGRLYAEAKFPELSVPSIPSPMLSSGDWLLWDSERVGGVS